MKPKKIYEKHIAVAIREYGMCSVLLRNAACRKLGLNITDMECLSILTINGTSTPTELAHFTGLTTGSATAMLDRLEKSKFIVRKSNPIDRRGVLIEVEKESMKKVASLFIDVQKAQNELIASYSGEELAIIADFLNRFTKNVKQYTNIIDKESSSSRATSLKLS